MEGFGPSAGGKMRFPMADDDLRRSLWEKPIWDGTVCVRTVSMEWNVPEVWAAR